MIQAGEFVDRLIENSFGPFIAVPCSFLKPLINFVIDSPAVEYLPANNEGEAIAIAAGYYLAGRKPVVMFQNSGLGNAVNPLTSLTHTFLIPLLLITTWRGQPGLRDEPQHELIGAITHDLFRTVRVGTGTFPKCSAEISPSVERALAHMETASLPYALIMEKGSVAPYELGTRESVSGAAHRKQMSATPSQAKIAPPPGRREFLAQLVRALPESVAVIATTGMTGRDLYCLAERQGNLYVVGSMGCASSLALGVALAQSPRHVIVLDGDGAALMRLEAMVSIGHYRPSNLIHVVLDNGVYDSTGGQPTLSSGVCFEGLASACGYSSYSSTDHSHELTATLRRCLATDGPHLIHVTIRPGSDPDTGRPALSPPEVKSRFMAFLQREHR